MGGVNKKKGSSKAKKDGKSQKQPKESKKPALPREDEILPLPQDRINAVRPFWEKLSEGERAELLTLDLEDLRERAVLCTERFARQAAQEITEAEARGEELVPLASEVALSDSLTDGVERLRTDRGTWKVWEWPDEDGQGGEKFYDGESFRAYLLNDQLEPEKRALLPRDPPGVRPVEKPAEAALRQRMSELLAKVQAHNRQVQEEAQPSRRPPRARRADAEPLVTRDPNAELITMMLAALEKEHEFLYQAVLFPVTGFVCDVLPEGTRESNRTELFYEDLERLPPEEVARICEWVTEKVDSFASKLKPEAKDADVEEEEEGIGDVDLFQLDKGSDERLAVHSKWLGHLTERQLGDDGHPRKVGPKEDPANMGLVLEWVYGSIVSTAEKARDGAKRTLGFGAASGRGATARAAYEALSAALGEQATWTQRAVQAKELLSLMLASRRNATSLSMEHEAKPGSEGATTQQLPDSSIMAMLTRESLLTRAKLHGLVYDQLIDDKRLRSLKTQLRQGEPEFDRLKRELEDVKNAPRGLEGTFRSAAEMERHRAAAADAAIEEQLEVQTSFRQHGARLQGIYDKRQRMEIEMAKRDQELKQLQAWRATVQSLLKQFEEFEAQASAATAAASAAASSHNGNDGTGDVEQGGSSSGEPFPGGEESRALVAAAAQASQQDAALQKLRQHFLRDVRKQLYTDEDDCTFFQWIQTERKAVEERLAAGAAALQHLEMSLVNTACDDPGAAIGSQLALPLLQERLDALALEHATKRAAEAEAAIVRMDEESREREAAVKEKKAQAKSKLKGKARSEKEKLAAEKLAAEAVTEAANRQAEADRDAVSRADKARKAELAQAAREEEDRIMEARRSELLKDEDSHWSKRMAAAAAASAQLLATQVVITPKDPKAPQPIKRTRPVNSALDNGNASEEETARVREFNVKASVAKSSASTKRGQRQTGTGQRQTGTGQRQTGPGGKPAGGGGSRRRSVHSAGAGPTIAFRPSGGVAQLPDTSDSARRVEGCASPQTNPARLVRRSTEATEKLPVERAGSPSAVSVMPSRNRTPPPIPSMQTETSRAANGIGSRDGGGEKKAPTAAGSGDLSESPPVPPSIVPAKQSVAVTQRISQRVDQKTSHGRSSSPSMSRTVLVVPLPPPLPADNSARPAGSLVPPSLPTGSSEPPSRQVVAAAEVAGLGSSCQTVDSNPGPGVVQPPQQQARGQQQPPQQQVGQPKLLQRPTGASLVQQQARGQEQQQQQQPSRQLSDGRVPPHAQVLPNQQLQQAGGHQPDISSSQPPWPRQQQAEGPPLPYIMPPPPGDQLTLPPGNHVMQRQQGQTEPRQLQPYSPTDPSNHHHLQHQGLPTQTVVHHVAPPLQGGSPRNRHNSPVQLLPPMPYVMSASGTRAGHPLQYSEGHVALPPPPAGYHNHALPSSQQHPQPVAVPSGVYTGHSGTSSPNMMQHPTQQLQEQPQQQQQPGGHLPQQQLDGSSYGAPFHQEAPHLLNSGTRHGAPLPYHQHQHQQEGQPPQVVAQRPLHQQARGQQHHHHQQQMHSQAVSDANGWQRQMGPALDHVHPPGHPLHDTAAHLQPPRPRLQRVTHVSMADVAQDGRAESADEPLQPGTPPLQDDGTPELQHSAVVGTGVRVDALAGIAVSGGGSRGGGGSSAAPPAPATPTLRPTLRASALPFVPRVAAPAFVPADITATSANTSATAGMLAGMGDVARDDVEPVMQIPAGSVDVATSVADVTASGAGVAVLKNPEQMTHDVSPVAQQGLSEQQVQVQQAEDQQGVQDRTSEPRQQPHRTGSGSFQGQPTLQQLAATARDSQLQQQQHQQQQEESSRGAVAFPLPAPHLVYPPSRTHTPQPGPKDNPANQQQRQQEQARAAQQSKAGRHAEHAGSAVDLRSLESFSQEAAKKVRNAASQPALGAMGSGVSNGGGEGEDADVDATSAAATAASAQPPLLLRWSAIAARHGSLGTAAPQAQRGSAETPNPRQTVGPGSIVPLAPAGGAPPRGIIPHSVAGSDRGSSSSLGALTNRRTAAQRMRVDSSGSISGASPTNGGTASQRAGGASRDDLLADTQRLSLVRGLTSESGQNNCFLNVIIQALWHLPCFRTELLQGGHISPQAPLEDRRVFEALSNIFRAFATQPNEAVTADSSADLEPVRPESPTTPFSSVHSGGSWAVSPSELRGALGALGDGAFNQSDMHDAAEVFAKMLACLHRAEAGVTEDTWDPQLPRRMPAGNQLAGYPGGRPNSTSLANGTSAPSHPRCSSVVRSLFGLEVEAPCPLDYQDSGSIAPQPTAPLPSRKGGQWSEVSCSGKISSSNGNSDRVGKKLDASWQSSTNWSHTHVLQYFKYFHLVPAAGLRVAYDTLLDGSFEDLVRAADASDLVSCRAAGGATSAADSASGRVPDLSLLSIPRVFTLALVWDSPQAPSDAISSTVAALHTEVDVAAVYARGRAPRPASGIHRLRCVVAYSGHHYQAYAKSEEVNRWLLFDDTNIKVVGSWADVKASLRTARHQPSLLFYDASPV